MGHPQNPGNIEGFCVSTKGCEEHVARKSSKMQAAASISPGKLVKGSRVATLCGKQVVLT